MPCAHCGSWEASPSWHLCEKVCANAQGVAKLHTGEEIRCNKSWDGTWWFFFCNTCKLTRPQIRGVLRGARICLRRRQYTDYITDSENASYYYSSESESCTQEEVEEFPQQWQAFDSTDGKGTWWWNRYTEDWFLESEPGHWQQFTDSGSGQPHWYHPDGRCFCASLDHWLIDDE